MSTIFKFYFGQMYLEKRQTQRDSSSSSSSLRRGHTRKGQTGQREGKKSWTGLDGMGINGLLPLLKDSIKQVSVGREAGRACASLFSVLFRFMCLVFGGSEWQWTRTVGCTAPLMAAGKSSSVVTRCPPPGGSSTA